MKIFLRMVVYDDGVSLTSSNHSNGMCLLNMYQNGYGYGYDYIETFYISRNINIRELIKKSLLLDNVFGKLKQYRISDTECMEGN
jgi:hypothetical protein